MFEKFGKIICYTIFVKVSRPTNEYINPYKCERVQALLTNKLNAELMYQHELQHTNKFKNTIKQFKKTKSVGGIKSRRK